MTLSGVWGGDEFVVFMKNVNERQKISRKAEQLMDNFQSSLPKEFSGCKLSVSIGVASVPKDGITQPVLYRKSDKVYTRRRKEARTRSVFMRNSGKGMETAQECGSHTLKLSAETDRYKKVLRRPAEQAVRGCSKR